jgi:hypothetical protein
MENEFKISIEELWRRAEAWEETARITRRGARFKPEKEHAAIACTIEATIAWNAVVQAAQEAQTSWLKYLEKDGKI